MFGKKKKENELIKAVTMTTIGGYTALAVGVEIKKAENEEARKQKEREEKAKKIANFLLDIID